jgi:CRISPR/Cas system-associated endonuclease Cas1
LIPAPVAGFNEPEWSEDLQEEFRHIVDSLVLFLLHRNMVTLGDFVSDGGSPLPCLMKKEFRKIFLRHLEEKLLTEFTPAGEELSVNYRDFFLRQARQIEAICHDPQKTYQSLRIR